MCAGSVRYLPAERYITCFHPFRANFVSDVPQIAAAGRTFNSDIVGSTISSTQMSYNYNIFDLNYQGVSCLTVICVVEVSEFHCKWLGSDSNLPLLLLEF